MKNPSSGSGGTPREETMLDGHNGELPSEYTETRRGDFSGRETQQQQTAPTQKQLISEISIHLN